MALSDPRARPLPRCLAPAGRRRLDHPRDHARGGDVIPTQEVPLPDMPAVPTLWAVHVQGPDDVIATVDKAEAEKHASAINAWYARQIERPDFDPATFPRVHAEVIEWPFSREGHTEDVARGDVRWAA